MLSGRRESDEGVDAEVAPVARAGHRDCRSCVLYREGRSVVGTLVDRRGTRRFEQIGVGGCESLLSTEMLRAMVLTTKEKLTTVAVARCLGGTVRR